MNNLKQVAIDLGAEYRAKDFVLSSDPDKVVDLLPEHVICKNLHDAFKFVSCMPIGYEYSNYEIIIGDKVRLFLKNYY